MTPIESFPHLLNEIFDDFNTAASVTINYEIALTNTSVHENPEVKVVSVNGFRSLTTFTNCIWSLKANLLCNLIEVVTGLDIQTKRLFIQHAITRSRKYLKTTIPVNPPSDDHDTTTHMRNYYGFNQPRYINALDHYPDDETCRLLAFRTRRYATMWKYTVEELIKELQGFFYLAEFLPALTPPVNSPPGTKKIPVRSSVAELAAMARLFFEHRAIALNNKSQFCRLVAEMFSTPRQKEISARSLKNHFDSPTPETIEFLFEEFRKMMQKFRNLGQVD